MLNRALGIRGGTGHLQRQSSAEDQRLAMRPRIAATQRIAQASGILVRFTSLEGLGGTPGEAVVRGSRTSRVTEPGRTSKQTKGPTGVGSSQPQAPWTTRLRAASMPDSVSAMSSAMGSLNAPITWKGGRAGLVRGPRY